MVLSKKRPKSQKKLHKHKQAKAMTPNIFRITIEFLNKKKF